jgi:hypothetical protein
MIEVLKHFVLSDFDAAGEPGTGQNMRISTLMKVDAMREAYGKPITIRHGFRTKTAAFRIQKAHPGAVKNSAHEHGFAVDCAPSAGFKNYGDWLDFMDAAWEAGFRRFGVMANTIHLDDDPNRATPACWKYATTLPGIWEAVSGWYAKKTGK